MVKQQESKAPHEVFFLFLLEREKNQSLRSLKKLQIVGKNNREEEATHWNVPEICIGFL